MANKTTKALSVDYLSKLGYQCTDVERWIPYTPITKDAFGFGDLLAYGRGHIALVQSTSWANFNARKTKILSSLHYSGWKKCGGKIFLHAWGPKGLREESL